MPTLTRWLLVAGFCLSIFGAKLWLLDTAGSDLPAWDQWDAEGEVMLRPWLEGWMGQKEIFHPHNEHRLVTTKLFNLGLFIANGQWDNLLEATVNAAVHTACALVLLFLALPWLPRPWPGVFAALLTLLFTLPFGWENSLFGFQVQFYFLLLFSLGHLGLTLKGDGFSIRWGVGQICGLLAALSLASGFLSALGVLAVLGHRLVRERRWSAQQITTTSLALIFTVLGWILKNDVPAHAVLRAHDAGQFAGAFFKLLTWPGVSLFPWSLLLVLPAALFVIRAARRRTTSGQDAVMLGLIAWVLLQAAAMAYARGSSEAVFAPRYLDLLAVNVAIGFLLLVREFSGRTRIWLAAAWLVLVGAGLAQQTRLIWRGYVEPNIARQHRQEGHVRDYLRSGDPANLLNAPAGDVPYPVGSVLVRRLESRVIQNIMPASVRRPVGLAPLGPAAVPPTLPTVPWPVAFSTWSLPFGHPPLEWRSPRQPAVTLPVLRFRVAGDLGRPGHQLQLIVKSAAGEVPVEPATVPGAHWKTVSVFRPAGEWWLEARDSDPDTWFAFTEPVEVGRWSWLAGKLMKSHFAIMLIGAALLVGGGRLDSRRARA